MRAGRRRKTRHPLTRAFEQRLAKIEHRLEEGLNESDTSMPKMREKIDQLEKELAQARKSSNLDRQTQEPHGTSVGQAVSHHASQNTQHLHK